MNILRSWWMTCFITVGTAVILFFMGQPLISTSGTMQLWVGELGTPEGSQHIADWYSASHFIHGLLFFGILYLFNRQVSLGTRFVIATLIEAGWEILENSPIIIDRYREATIAFGYSGDSVLNSTTDMLFMMAGFWFARLVPWWVTVLVIIGLELFVGFMIRDNLALNILMLVYPIDAVRVWQSS